MVRWFTLTSATTYNWRSKVSGEYYQFVGDKAIAVTHPRDQERFSNNTQRFVEVDEKGSILDKERGGTMTRSAFSRRGMVKQPQSYTRVGQRVAAPVAAVVPEPAKPVATRTVTSSKKAVILPEVVAEVEPTKDAISESAPPEDSAPKKAKKAKKAKRAPKKAKKSGRAIDE